MTRLLTRSEVAERIGRPTGTVPAWTFRHGITGIWVSGQTLYPADQVTRALNDPHLRLARFIRNPLNH